MNATAIGSQTEYDIALATVCRVLCSLELPDLTRGALGPDSLLLELGLDSVSFVELTVRLEEELGVERFPMQEWVDERYAAGLPLSVGALSEACAPMLDGSSGGSAHDTARG